ncbi:G-protein coupled receptor Mth2-like [Ochlerotatus camptorhynchus]|uniref:G-protein coupled receptor Mth2-like n=1 Tax=Ochlerotatus camptorhynchus TaxID=644619 RepID=UPI0031DB7CAC
MPKIRAGGFLSVAHSLVTVVVLVVAAAAGGTDSAGQLPCEFRDSVNITSGVRDTLGNILYSNIKYTPEHYAVINYDYVEYDVRISVPNYYRGCVCQVTNCVRLCCPVGQWFVSREESVTTCVDGNSLLSPALLTNVTTANGVRLVNLVEDQIFGFVHQKPCPALLIEDASQWALDDAGAILLMDMVVPQEEYCLAVGDDTGLVAAYMCPLPLEEGSITYSIGLIISIPFLVATLLIYACIPELRNIHGKSLICYVLALTCVYIVMLMTHFDTSIVPCVVRAYLFYFFVMVSFFWLNVMCFDIFWTFSSGVLIKNEKKRFLYYSLYAWGCPLILVSMVAVFENTEILNEDLRPGFGLNNCSFINEKLIQFLYLYLPLLILVAMNLYFFIVTAIRIIRVQRATEAVLRNDSGRHSRFEKDRYRFTLYLRLFIVMGVTWTFEIVSWAMENNIWLFYVTDICNCLLGVMIFFLFVWKQKVRKLVAKRIGRHRNLGRKKTSVNATSTMGGSKYTSVQDTTTIPLNTVSP